MLRGTLRGRIASFGWLKSTDLLLHHLGILLMKEIPTSWCGSHIRYYIYIYIYILYTICTVYIYTDICFYIYTTYVCMYVIYPLTPFNMVFTHQERCTNSSSTGWPQVADCFLRQTVAKTVIQPLCQYTMKGRFQNFPHGFTGENICQVGRLEFSSFSCLSTMGPCWGWQPNPINSSTWTYDIKQWIPLNLEHRNYSKSVCPSYLCSEGC